MKSTNSFKKIIKKIRQNGGFNEKIIIYFISPRQSVACPPQTWLYPKKANSHIVQK
jgi:hypothetical protein